MLKQKIHRMRTVSVRVSLRCMLRLIRVDTLRSVHNVGFLMELLNYILLCKRNMIPPEPEDNFELFIGLTII